MLPASASSALTPSQEDALTPSPGCLTRPRVRRKTIPSSRGTGTTPDHSRGGSSASPLEASCLSASSRAGRDGAGGRAITDHDCRATTTPETGIEADDPLRWRRHHDGSATTTPETGIEADDPPGLASRVDPRVGAQECACPTTRPVSLHRQALTISWGSSATRGSTGQSCEDVQEWTTVRTLALSPTRPQPMLPREEMPRYRDKSLPGDIHIPDVSI